MSSWLEYKKNSIEKSSWSEYKKKQIEKEKEEEKKQEIINNLKNSTTVNQQITQLPTANNSNVNYLNNTKNSLIKPIENNVPIVNNVLPEDAKKLTSTDIKAMEEAIELNKEIEKGGSDAVNAVIGNTIKSFTGGVQKGVAGIANAAMLPVSWYLGKVNERGKELGILEDDNIFEKGSQGLLDESDRISAIGNYSGNVNSRIDNAGVRIAGNVMNTVGNMVPSMVANVVAPGSGLVMTGISAGGNSAQETLNYNKDNMEQALTTGVLKGAVEMATEKITGGNLITKGGLDNVAVRFIGNHVKSEVGQKIASKGYEFLGEIIEEELSDIGGYIIDKVINNKDTSLKEAWNNAGETAKMTFLSTLVLNAFGLGGNTYNDVKEYTKNKEANTWINEAMKIAKQENLDTMIRNDIEKRVIQKDAQNPVNNQVNTQEQQTISQENKMAQNQNTEQIDNHKQHQLDIITNTNPMTDDYHTGIRSIDDIKTFDEVINDDESFVYGDFSKQDAEKALKDGKVTVYSSKPIEQGSFVSTSQNMAQDYAGNGQIYSQEVNLNDVAWINGDEGQYAKVENVANNLETLYNNNESEGINNGEQQVDRDLYAEQEKKNEEMARRDTEIFERIKELNRDTKREIRRERAGLNELVNEELSRLPVSKTKAEKFLRKLANNPSISQEDIKTFLNDNNLYKEKTINEEFAQARKDISSYQFKLSEDIKSELKYNYGNIPRNIKLNNNGLQVDQIYQELSNKYPDIFSDEIVNPSDQASIIIDFMRDINPVNIYEARVLSDEELDEASMLIYTYKQNFEEAKKYYKQYYLTEKEKIKSEDSNKSSFILPKADKTIQDVGLPTVENTTVKQDTNQIIEKADILPVTPEQKARKHYKSIIESNYTTDEAKAVAKELMNSDTYEPESNVKQLETADKRIQTSGAESELNSLMSRAINGGTIKADDIAVGERLIQYYSKTGDKAKLQEAIQATAMAGTTAGQTVQAMSLLNHQTPQGQAVWLQRSVEKMNNDLKKQRGPNAEQFTLTPEMIEKIVGSENTEQLNNNLDEVYKELGQQVSKSTIEKIDAWRYFAMLGNFRTHIRNLAGNFFMGMTQDVKNKVAGGIEGVVAKFNPDMERTHTIKRPSQEVLEFAKKDIKNVKAELSGNKYTPKSMLQNNMRTFKSDAMENTLGRLFKWNDTLLEAEDALGLKSGYKKALAEYITANDIDIDNITDKQLAKARRYAVQEAKERAFHQANTIASAINSFTNKNKITKAVGDAAIPFVKTPANIAKTGIEYSPAGLAKSIVYDTVQLRQGNINVNQYIDNLSKGLTGSAITVLGYALAEAGILKASGGDDEKKEQFDEQSGKQAYSIQIGDKTFSIDWLAPVGIPLMVGAEIHEGLSQNKDEKTSKSSNDEEPLNKFLDRAQVITDSMASTLNPMVEMSMISGLVSSIRSFAKGDTQALSGMMTNMGKSYINQFVPTGLGHIAKATDTVERDTTSTKSGSVEKAIDSTINQIKSKVPGLRQTLPTKKDIWGEEQKLNDNWALRFIEAGILPMNIKQIKDNKVVNELNRLYEKNGEASVLPTTINKKITIDGQDYRLTNEEFNKYKTSYGRTSYELINNLIGSSDYNKLSEAEKQTAIEKIYTYAKEQNKIDYAKNNKISVEPSTLYDTMHDLKTNGGKQIEYINYLAKTNGMSKEIEKNKTLLNSNYTNNTKEIIYLNGTGKDDSTYSIMKKTGIDINAYLKYKMQNFEADKDDNGTSIKGSKETKIYEYLNGITIPYEQKLTLLGMQYKLQNQKDRINLINYINRLDISEEERQKILKKQK